MVIASQFKFDSAFFVYGIKILDLNIKILSLVLFLEIHKIINFLENKSTEDCI